MATERIQWDNVHYDSLEQPGAMEIKCETQM